jgi:hypothetical protein
MSNAFGFVLDNASVRRATVEGVPETVVAAIYLLHEWSAGDVAAKLTLNELEHVISPPAGPAHIATARQGAARPRTGATEVGK